MGVLCLLAYPLNDRHRDKVHFREEETRGSRETNFCPTQRLSSLLFYAHSDWDALLTRG